MRIADAMTRDVQVIRPDQSIVDAARMMAECDVGALPVADNDRLVGMLTDRDIVVRGLAQGKAADARVQDVMSPDVKYCFDDEDLDDVAQNMGDLQIRRLPVVSRDKRLVGIVSLGDIATTDEEPAGEALSHISEPSSGAMGTGQRPH
ncbi:MAG TPA: CBS domain-containing protein [Noviherbaspirillum sp.]